MHSARFRECSFTAAAKLWLESQRARLAPVTMNYYEDYARMISSHLGDLPLRDFHAGHVESYQKLRQAQIRGSQQHVAAQRKYGIRDQVARRTDGASIINHEVACVLAPVLRRAGLWAEIKQFYHPLPVPKEGPGIALEEDEEELFFKVLASRPRWRVCYHCAMLARGTGADPGEVRHLRLRDVDIAAGRVHFAFTDDWGKNQFRDRTVVVVGRTLESLRWLHARALDKGALLPDHFLLPSRTKKRGEPDDPTRPMSSDKKAWYAARALAAQQHPRLAEFRRKDLRHTAITKMLETPALSYSTIETQVGHRLGSNIKRRYEHIRDASMRAAAEVLESGKQELPPAKPVVSVQAPAAKPQRAAAQAAMPGALLWKSSTFGA